MSWPTDSEVRDAYRVISAHLNGGVSYNEEHDPLLQALSCEHPTLQMTLLRVLSLACSRHIKVEEGKVTYHDGRYPEAWAEFVAHERVPIV